MEEGTRGWKGRTEGREGTVRASSVEPAPTGRKLPASVGPTCANPLHPPQCTSGFHQPAVTRQQTTQAAAHWWEMGTCQVGTGANTPTEPPHLVPQLKGVDGRAPRVPRRHVLQVSAAPTVETPREMDSYCPLRVPLRALLWGSRECKTLPFLGGRGSPSPGVAESATHINKSHLSVYARHKEDGKKSTGSGMICRGPVRVRGGRRAVWQPRGRDREGKNNALR